MKLGVDVGNYNINTSENVMFKAAVSTFKDFGSTADKIVIDNKAYYLGDGYLEIDYRKFDKSNYLPLLLGAICKSTTHEEIELGLGLPLTQYKGFKTELINMLNKKEFNVVFNNKNRNIKITKVDVFPEGVASLIASFDFKSSSYNLIFSANLLLFINVFAATEASRDLSKLKISLDSTFV